jgi:hypothetical protein
MKLIFKFGKPKGNESQPCYPPTHVGPLPPNHNLELMILMMYRVEVPITNHLRYFALEWRSIRRCNFPPYRKIEIRRIARKLAIFFLKLKLL